MKIPYVAQTDTGLIRSQNEDSYLAEPTLGLFAVADGMGGHASGEVASRMAIETLREFFSRPKENLDPALRLALSKDPAGRAHPLVRAVELANRRIYQASQEKVELRGMGTTLVAIDLSPAGAFWANVGDSRLYQIRNREIRQLTEDHSLAWEHWKQGLLPKAALSKVPYKHIITRALGIHPAVDVDGKEFYPQFGDQFILCSDGLSDLVEDQEMLEILWKAGQRLEEAARRLIDLANSRGGNDNITVLILGPLLA